MNSAQVIVIGIVFVLFWVVLTYNRFITLRNRVKEAFSDIDVQLKRRYDLIPNLVETVKGYASHEQGVFQKVTEARTRAMEASSLKDRAREENMLSETLKSLFAVAENYPDLKASQNFLELQRELRDAENKIQAARRFHNANVMSLNTKIEHVPSNLIAQLFGFKHEELFEIEEAQRMTPQVKF